MTSEPLIYERIRRRDELDDASIVKSVTAVTSQEQMDKLLADGNNWVRCRSLILAVEEHPA